MKKSSNFAGAGAFAIAMILTGQWALKDTPQQTEKQAEQQVIAIGHYQDNHPHPRGCDRDVAPVGDKLCHYEVRPHWYATEGFSWDRINEQ